MNRNLSPDVRLYVVSALLLCGGVVRTDARYFPTPLTDSFKDGQSDLKQALNDQEPNKGVAKNVVLMIGDGMGISTVTASRIYGGQLEGKSGEENKLAFETLRYAGLLKTYCDDSQVTDSASAATAYVSGYKAPFGTLGLKPGAVYQKCASMAGKEIESILKMSQKEGKSTGFITTTALTHATVAATYAHTPARFWENDADIPAEEANIPGCRDVAYQLVYNNPDINVMLAGGRREFLPKTTPDPEYPETFGQRADGRDLFQVWQETQKSKNRRYSYVWNKDQFDTVNPSTTDYLMGGFEPYYMKYMDQRDPDDSEPTLSEMTEKAIQILSKNPKGYFLMIEGGKIDTAHHGGLARTALEETLEYARAVQKVKDMTSEKDTLLVVTADHSHTLTIGGFPSRGNDVLGFAEYPEGVAFIAEPTDGFPYTTLGYYNGPGGSVRTNLTGVDTTAKTFRQPVHVPLPLGTHAGEDVGVYSRGPLAHLLSSTRENNYVFHVMAYASCVGPDKSHCDQPVTTTTTTRTPQACSGSTHFLGGFAALAAILAMLV